MPSFDSNSLKASSDLIEELKLLTRMGYYSPIKTETLECDKNKMLEKVKNKQKEILQTIDELKKIKKKQKN